MTITKIPAVMWGAEPSPDKDAKEAGKEILAFYNGAKGKHRPICIIMDATGENKTIFDFLRDCGLPMQEMTINTIEPNASTSRN